MEWCERFGGLWQSPGEWRVPPSPPSAVGPEAPGCAHLLAHSRGGGEAAPRGSLSEHRTASSRWPCRFWAGTLQQLRLCPPGRDLSMDLMSPPRTAASGDRGTCKSGGSPVLSEQLQLGGSLYLEPGQTLAKMAPSTSAFSPAPTQHICGKRGGGPLPDPKESKPRRQSSLGPPTKLSATQGPPKARVGWRGCCGVMGGLNPDHRHAQPGGGGPSTVLQAAQGWEEDIGYRWGIFCFWRGVRLGPGFWKDLPQPGCPVTACSTPAETPNRQPDTTRPCTGKFPSRGAALLFPCTPVQR